MSTIPTATISRLVLYLRTLEQLEAAGVKTTSSDFLADEAQSTAFQVRKDLAYLDALARAARATPYRRCAANSGVFWA